MLKLRKKYSAKKQEKDYYYIQLNGMNYGIFFQIYDGQNTYLIEKIMESWVELIVLPLNQWLLPSLNVPTIK